MATKTFFHEMAYWDFCREMIETPAPLDGYLGRTFARYNEPLSSLVTTREKKWDLGAQWEGAVEMATTGYRKASKALHDVRASQRNTVDLGAPSYEWDVVGMMPDVPEFLTGNPDNMMSWGEDESHPVVKIGLAGAYHCGNPAQYATNLGGAVLTLIDAMEAAGYAVELAVCFRVKGGPTRVALNVVVKSADEIVDVDRVGYAVCHPAFFRRLFFRYMELLPDAAQQDLGMGYGRPERMGDEREDWDICIPAPDRSTSQTPEKALATVLKAAGDLVEIDG